MISPLRWGLLDCLGGVGHQSTLAMGEVGWAFRRERRHVIGFWIQLMLKKEGKVIVNYIAQKQLV